MTTRGKGYESPVPNLDCGRSSDAALVMALAPFEGMIGERVTSPRAAAVTATAVAITGRMADRTESNPFT